VNEPSVVFSSSKLPSHAGGKLLELPRQKIGWEWMSFYVTRLQPGEVMRRRTEKEESAFVLLGGSCVADWGDGKRTIGKRQNVFAGLPYTLYLPANSEVSFTAETACEFAECSVPSNAQLEPRLITPGDVVTSLRGGGNVSRQIVDVMPPAFPADKLVVIEVYTPGGNWSSYPPHKHDVHNPPAEVDLEEIYYYRLDRPEGYAIQKVYTADRRIDETLSVRDGELVLIPEGYHPVVGAHGYNVYYLNALAGSARSMAASDDPDYAWVRDTWREQDPRLPMVKM
jgi:5-deoxy-glucuronate isomerase